MLQKCNVERALVSDQVRSHGTFQSQGSAELELVEDQGYSRESASQGSAAGEELGEPGLSDDEDLFPDQPAFIGLFKPQIFRSLLHKAKITMGLGLPLPKSSYSATGVGPSSLFEEPTFEAEEIPGPKMFKDVVTRQWSAPVSGPNPNTVDRHLYNLDFDFSSILQVPAVDPPIVALSTSSVLTGPPEEGLRPEDKAWSILLQMLTRQRLGPLSLLQLLPFSIGLPLCGLDNCRSAYLPVIPGLTRMSTKF